MKVWNLGRLELACEQIRDLQDEAALRIRGARKAGATYRELEVASGLTKGQLRRILERR